MTCCYDFGPDFILRLNCRQFSALSTAGLLQLVIFVYSGRSFFCRVVASESALNNIFEAFFQDYAFDIFKMLAAVMMIVVCNHAGGKMDCDFIFFQTKLLCELV